MKLMPGSSRSMTLVLTQNYKVVGVLTQTWCQTLFERNFWDVLSGLPRAHFSSVYLCVWLVGWLVGFRSEFWSVVAFDSFFVFAESISDQQF